MLPLLEGTVENTVRVMRLILPRGCTEPRSRDLYLYRHQPDNHTLLLLLIGRYSAGCANCPYTSISRLRIANRRWPSSTPSCLLTMLPRTQAPTSP